MWSRELGKQLYLGGFDAECEAARAFDVCSLKKWRDERGARRGHLRARSPSAAGYMSSCCVCAVSCVSEVFEQRTVIHGPWQPICRVLARNGEGHIN